MALLQFDASAVQPDTMTFDPIPAGNYTAIISESEVVQTKSGTGQMLKLRWDVVDGPMKGRVVFDRLNIVNSNPKAEEIGQRQLSSLCHAAGVMQLQDTQQLHGVPVSIKVAIRKDETGQYGDSNEVKGYRQINTASAPVLGQVAPPPQQQPAAGFGAGSPPWAGNRAS